MLCSPSVSLFMLSHVNQQLCARHPTILFTLIAVVPASTAVILVECKACDLPVAQHVNKDGSSTLTSRLAEIAQHWERYNDRRPLESTPKCVNEHVYAKIRQAIHYTHHTCLFSICTFLLSTLSQVIHTELKTVTRTAAITTSCPRGATFTYCM